MSDQAHLIGPDHQPPSHRSMYDTAFLHVGYDKAGSTALQNASALLHKELQLLGVHYPEPIVTENHDRIASAFFTNPSQADFNKANERSSWSDAQIRQEDKIFLEAYEKKIASGWGTLFLSFEGFIWLSSLEHSQLREWLMKFAPKIKVVVYAREPLQYAESAISQRVRTGRSIKVGYHRHDVNMAKLIKVYGRENVIVREFGHETLEGGDIRSDFYSLIGLKEPHISELLSQDAVLGQEANRSLSMHAVGIGEALRVCLTDTDFLDLPGAESRFEDVFGSVLSIVPGPRFTLNVAQEWDLFRRPEVRAASRYLLDEFGIDFRWRKRNALKTLRIAQHRNRKQFQKLRKQGVYAQLGNFLVKQMAAEIEQCSEKNYTAGGSLPA